MIDRLSKPAIWHSPAKLNLFLHITGQRPDGWHNLQTLFVFLDYGDTIEISVDYSGKIYRDDTAEKYPNDLILRAANLLKDYSGVNLGAKISLTKNIPAGGGLGGGSSNAATILVALNKLWDLKINKEVLAKLGLSLGADVPIFISGFSSFAEGVGESLQRYDAVCNWVLVINTNIKVNTAEIFSVKDLTRDTITIKICALSSLISENKLRNDFLPVVSEMYPEIDNAINWLNQFTAAKLTGTGGCIFGEFSQKQQAETILNNLPPQWDGFVTQISNVSSLYKQR